MSNELMSVRYETTAGEMIELNQSIVRQFVTKGNAEITDQEAFNFLKLCESAKLNPFLNEVYLVKFGSQPVQMITSKEAYMKRANRNQSYNGFEAGITILRDGQIQYREGQTFYKQAGEQLIGGWARVYRKDIERPFYQEVSLDEYGKGQSTWKVMPGNMIRKTALVGALREAFPEDLGALYTEEEPNYDALEEVQREPEEKTKELLQGFHQQEATAPELKEPTKEAEVVEAVVVESVINPRIGKRLKEIRTESGMNQKDFGALVGVSSSTISEWENSKSLPNAQQNQMIAKIATEQKETEEQLEQMQQAELVVDDVVPVVVNQEGLDLEFKGSGNNDSPFQNHGRDAKR